MPYVFVEDVAASWECYEDFAGALRGTPPEGLLVHAAGRTEEGFRVVAVWESEEAWRSFVERAGSTAPAGAPSAFRALHPEHVVYGEGGQAMRGTRRKTRRGEATRVASSAKGGNRD